MHRLILFSIFLAPTLWASVPSCAGLVSARDFATVLAELNGGALLHPTLDSLIGRYLKETGAQSFRFRFETGQGEDRGPEKLVVLVSPESFPAFRQRFGVSYPNVIEHLHTPQQGTLLVRWMNATFMHASPRGEWRFPTVGTLGPMILFSDNEAQRVENYFRVNATGHPYCRVPSELPEYGYPPDAYGKNCTAWFGHIPVGDTVALTVTSPGSLDQWGDGKGREPRRGTLAPYPFVVGGVDEAMFRRVWSVPLPTRLFDLIGVPIERGNHTNPGWVATSLLALAIPERVPFVAYYTADHRRLPAGFSPQIKRVGNVVE